MTLKSEVRSFRQEIENSNDLSLPCLKAIGDAFKASVRHGDNVRLERLESHKSSCGASLFISYKEAGTLWQVEALDCGDKSSAKLRRMAKCYRADPENQVEIYAGLVQDDGFEPKVFGSES